MSETTSIETSDEPTCSDCLQPMGIDGMSCDCYCAGCGEELAYDCRCDEECCDECDGIVGECDCEDA